MIQKGTSYRNIAVILAGGVGMRLGKPMPKQYLKIHDRMVFEYTVDAFELAPGIDEIALVCSAEFESLVKNTIAKNRWTKVKKVLKGGAQRYFSTLAAVNEYRNNQDHTNLIFHDAVRPLVSQRIIRDTIEALNRVEAVDVAAPVSDTILEYDPNTGQVIQIPDRRCWLKGQTPQAFRASVIAKAFEIGLNDPDFNTTDDCTVVMRYLPDTPVHVVLGSERNMKLTFPEDLPTIEKLLQTPDTDR
jgi:2-C-methyl-D-erythritol 4-phosphate cytidylyltransferase